MNLKPKTYLYATVHRAENTDRKEALRNILESFGESGETIVFPVHPRTKKQIQNSEFRISKTSNSLNLLVIWTVCNFRQTQKSLNRFWWCSEGSIYFKGALHYSKKRNRMG